MNYRRVDERALRNMQGLYLNGLMGSKKLIQTIDRTVGTYTGYKNDPSELGDLGKTPKWVKRVQKTLTGKTAAIKKVQKVLPKVAKVAAIAAGAVLVGTYVVAPLVKQSINAWKAKDDAKKMKDLAKLNKNAKLYKQATDLEQQADTQIRSTQADISQMSAETGIPAQRLIEQGGGGSAYPTASESGGVDYQEEEGQVAEEGKGMGMLPILIGGAVVLFLMMGKE